MNTTKVRQPTFIGVGGHKCASTWLSECLRYHPEVFMSSPKEVHYFDQPRHLEKGHQWYLNHFDRAKRNQAIGEFTATYLADAISVRKIREMLGEIKIIVSLREPVERFISQYKHYIRRNNLPKTQFRVLDERTLNRAIEKCPTLLTYGQYHRNLIRFYTAFGFKNIHVILKDEVDSNPTAVLRSLFETIGVDEGHVSPLLKKQVSPGIVPKYPRLESLRRNVFGFARDHAPRMIDLVRRSGLAERYRRFNREPEENGLVVTDGVRQRLYEMHEEEIQRTEQLIEKSLARWMLPSDCLQTG